ncbi:unnamed protein product [Ixodes pacificus]
MELSRAWSSPSGNWHTLEGCSSPTRVTSLKYCRHREGNYNSKERGAKVSLRRYAGLPLKPLRAVSSWSPSSTTVEAHTGSGCRAPWGLEGGPMCRKSLDSSSVSSSSSSPRSWQWLSSAATSTLKRPAGAPNIRQWNQWNRPVVSCANCLASAKQHWHSSPASSAPRKHSRRRAAARNSCRAPEARAGWGLSSPTSGARPLSTGSSSGFTRARFWGVAPSATPARDSSRSSAWLRRGSTRLRRASSGPLKSSVKCSCSGPSRASQRRGAWGDRLAVHAITRALSRALWAPGAKLPSWPRR